MKITVGTAMDWRAWLDFGRTLDGGPGVHAPSAFSALLAQSLGDVRGKIVIDAGCGAGLVSIAALAAGASRVVALDHDPVALEITSRNAGAALPRAFARRLVLEQADFSTLGDISADLIAVNPPQRPSRLLIDVEADQRHLHEGGGDDGLRTLRRVLAVASETTVRSTAARALDVSAMLAEPSQAGRQGQVLASADLPAHRCWAMLAGPGPLAVDVWCFAGSSAERFE